MKSIERKHADKGEVAHLTLPVDRRRLAKVPVRSLPLLAIDIRRPADVNGTSVPAPAPTMGGSDCPAAPDAGPPEPPAATGMAFIGASLLILEKGEATTRRTMTQRWHEQQSVEHCDPRMHGGWRGSNLLTGFPPIQYPYR